MKVDCIYCGGIVGESCLDPQGHQQAAFEKDNPSEQTSTPDKLREMYAGFAVVLNRDEVRILKLLDRANAIRTKPYRKDGVDSEGGSLWEAWFEWQTLHDDDLQQRTGGHPCKTCSGKGKGKLGVTCGDCNGLGFLT